MIPLLVRLYCITRKIPNLLSGMKKGAVTIIGGIAALVQATEAAYVWPSQYDEIEDILSLQTGYRSRGFVEGQQRPFAIGLPLVPDTPKLTQVKQE